MIRYKVNKLPMVWFLFTAVDRMSNDTHGPMCVGYLEVGVGARTVLTAGSKPALHSHTDHLPVHQFQRMGRLLTVTI